MEQKGSLRKPADKGNGQDCFLQTRLRAENKTKFQRYNISNLVSCSCMFSNKLNGVWGYSKKKTSNIEVLGLLNCPIKIFHRNGSEECITREMNHKPKTQRLKGYPKPNFLVFLNAQTCSS